MDWLYKILYAFNLSTAGVLTPDQTSLGADAMSYSTHAARTPPNMEGLPAKVAELEAKIKYLSDREDIVDVLLRYTRGIDRYDMELLTSALWPDAQVISGPLAMQRDEFIRGWREENYLVGLASQGHHITNVRIDIGDDVAHVESYLIALWRPPSDEKPALIRGGRYIDRLDRRNGEWRIAVRVFIPHFWAEATSICNSRTETWPKPVFGAFDSTDPSYYRPLNPRPTESVGGG